MQNFKHFNSERYIQDLINRADIDYCIGRLLHYGFYFAFEAKYHFQQSIEKYLKALIVQNQLSKFSGTATPDDELKKFGHALEKLWKECRQLYPEQRMFEDVNLSAFILKEFDRQSVEIRSRYPAKSFGGHPVSFSGGYIQTIDTIVFMLRQEVLKTKKFPIDTARSWGRFWFTGFSISVFNQPSPREHLLEKTFYYKNLVFCNQKKRKRGRTK